MRRRAGRGCSGDFAGGRLRARYAQAPDFQLTNLPFARRDLLDKRNYLTKAVFEASRSRAHDREFCVAPTAWGRKQLQKPIDHVVEDIRRVGAKKILFIDLNLISDRAYARDLFTAPIPLNIRWFGLRTAVINRALSHHRRRQPRQRLASCRYKLDVFGCRLELGVRERMLPSKRHFVRRQGIAFVNRLKALFNHV